MDIDMVPEGHVGARSAVLAVWRHLFGNDAPDRPIRFARQEVRDGVVVEVPTPDDARADQERGDAEYRVAVDWLLGALQRREVDAWFRDPDRNEWSMVRATYWSGKGGKGAMVGRLDGAGLQPQE
ncbi:MAG: hypothetical protein JNK11_09270, partial [Alphaproteobacteria bacterium]|nr:hypothetical protein [Alphaproteobacteria bacterium]